MTRRCPRTKIFRLIPTARLNRGLLYALVTSILILPGCSWLRTFVGQCPEKAHQLAQEARQAEEHGQVAEAAKLFEKALKAAPKDPQLHREMARLQLQLNQPNEAKHHLHEAIKHNPDDVDANLELARLYLEHGQHEEAMHRLDAALQNDPQQVAALELRAKLAESFQDTSEAIETYHRILSFEPYHVEARLRVAHLQLENHQPSLSAPMLRSVCHCSDANADQIAQARWTLGVAYGQEGRWPESVQSLVLAQQHDYPMTADRWYRLAYARGQLGDWAGAQSDLSQALRINPNHENAQAMLNSIRKDQGSQILRLGHSVKSIPVPLYW